MVGKIIIYKDILHGDFCKCASCGKKMLLPIGSDKCPECGEEMLEWADSSQERDVSSFSKESIIEGKRLQITDSYSADYIKEELIH
jgi:uncharacterized OB-fold protein